MIQAKGSDLFKNWWLLTLNGVAAILFGITAIFLPEITLLVLINYFGIMAVFLGMFFILGGIYYRKKNKLWRFWIYEGNLNFIIGLVILFNPRLTIEIFIILVALWAILTGFAQLISAIKLKEFVPKRTLYLVNGIIGIVFGSIIIFSDMDYRALALVLGFYAIIEGVFCIVISFVMKNISKIIAETTTETFHYTHSQ